MAVSDGNSNITIYGASWCPDCRRAKKFLNEQRVSYNWVDIEQMPEAQQTVQDYNNGKQIIPTIVFKDNGILVEPTNAELAKKLGLQSMAKNNFYDLIVVGSGPAVAADPDCRAAAATESHARRSGNQDAGPQALGLDFGIVVEPR